MHKLIVLISTCCLAAAPQSPTNTRATAKPEAHPVPIAFDGSAIGALQVADLARAKDWYAATLGCKVQFEMLDHGWCEMTTPVANAWIGLSQVEKPTANGGSSLSFGVADIALAKAWLEKQGVRLSGDVVVIEKTVKLLSFFDPDGNKLMFYEPYRAQ
jgi:predicted enzyme related to lactoylglutathione lyase